MEVKDRLSSKLWEWSGREGGGGRGGGGGGGGEGGRQREVRGVVMREGRRQDLSGPSAPPGIEWGLGRNGLGTDVVWNRGQRGVVWG